ncbi:hypothetical protein BUALT_Bualt01G0034800 [Buddleja alternifolia]|uniref:Cathepsin propeptide inhibitor domain-containing protein n=1 Tax=Buddleja alternifolia TaxID=168488 RepID=A0AAV6YF37_9LAMI|nr:hypothetical protein BUALT_Bualt01G0034800 [Buddleja alternifolia]
MAAALRRSSSLTRVMTWNSGLIRAFSTRRRSSPISKLFDSWCEKYKKTYPSEEVKEERYHAFRKSYKFVQRHSGCTLNEFADRDPDFLKTKVGGTIYPENPAVHGTYYVGTGGGPCGGGDGNQDFNK